MKDELILNFPESDSGMNDDFFPLIAGFSDQPFFMPLCIISVSKKH